MHGLTGLQYGFHVQEIRTGAERDFETTHEPVVDSTLDGCQQYQLWSSSDGRKRWISAEWAVSSERTIPRYSVWS